MVAAIKQTVTVGEGGRIEIPTSHLAPGTRVDVVVQVDQPSAGTAGESQLDALRALQASMQLDAAAAERWAQEVRAERDGSRRPPV